MRKSSWAQHSMSTLIPKVRFFKTFRTTLSNWKELRKEISALSWIRCALCLRVPLPKNLWAEAIIAACYIKSRCTSSSKSTPHELWFRTKPDVSGLLIYGWSAFVHVPREKRKVLTDRSEECILIGWGSGSIYRLLTKKTRKLIIARDVKFDESLVGFGNFRNKVEP